MIRQVALAVCSSLLFACSGGDIPGSTKPTRAQPVLLALDTYSAAVGTPVGVFGVNFPSDPNERGRPPMAVMHLVGTFEQSDGTLNDVDISSVLRRKIDQSLVWDSFGPYINPFTRTEAIGTFTGTVQVDFLEVGPDGLPTKQVAETPEQNLRFTVEPSIFVRRLRPVDSQCSSPVTTTLAFHPYEVEVNAVGRDVRSYSFVMAGIYPKFDDGTAPPAALPSRVDVVAQDNRGIAGQNTGLISPPMPSGASNYVLTLDITAHTEDGRDITSRVVTMTHNPIANYRVGTRKLAQTYDPLVQGRCYEAGISTSTIEYSETHTESRTVSKQEAFSDEWGTAVQNGQAQATGETASDRTSYSVTAETSSNAGEGTSHSSNWKAGGKASIGGDIFGFEANGEYGESDSFSANTSIGSRDAATNGVDQTLGTTRSSTTTETLARNLSQGQSRSETYTVTSTDSTSQGYRADLFPGTTAVWYSQLSRYVTEAIVVRYNLCGQESVIGSSYLTNWSWAVDVSFERTCSPVPPPDDFEPGRCLLGNCDGG